MSPVASSRFLSRRFVAGFSECSPGSSQPPAGSSDAPEPVSCHIIRSCQTSAVRGAVTPSSPRRSEASSGRSRSRARSRRPRGRCPEMPIAAERCRQVAHEERVDPHGARAHRPSDALGALRRAGVDDRPRARSASSSRARSPSSSSRERLERKHRPEHLALDDLAVVRARDRRASARRRGRRRSAGCPPRTISSPFARARSTKPATRSKCSRMDQRRHRRRVVARDRRARARRRSGGRARGTARARDSWTRSRVPARHTWPASSYWPAALRAAASRSQSSKTSSGPLPPSSPVNGTMLLRRGDADVARRLRRAGERDAAARRGARRAPRRSPRRSPARR